jgi:hypothetical protein
MMETTVAAMLQATVAMEWRLTLSAAGLFESSSDRIRYLADFKRGIEAEAPEALFDASGKLLMTMFRPHWLGDGKLGRCDGLRSAHYYAAGRNVHKDRTNRHLPRR